MPVQPGRTRGKISVGFRCKYRSVLPDNIIGDPGCHHDHDDDNHNQFDHDIELDDDQLIKLYELNNIHHEQFDKYKYDHDDNELKVE
jgi:hypothetical protein